VTVDNVGGMRALTKHLVTEHAIRDLWFLGSASGYNDDNNARFKGFRSALRAANVLVPDERRLRDGSRTGARQAVADLVGQVPLPEAIVCATDQIALGVIDALRGAGIRVPQQMVVTGFDGIDAGRFLRPSLTTVRQPMDALGRVAVRILAEQIEQADRAPTHRQLPVQVVLRESCGCPPL
jgi:LacI family transcriptional regulator